MMYTMLIIDDFVNEVEKAGLEGEMPDNIQEEIIVHPNIILDLLAYFQQLTDDSPKVTSTLD